MVANLTMGFQSYHMFLILPCDITVMQELPEGGRETEAGTGTGTGLDPGRIHEVDLGHGLGLGQGLVVVIRGERAATTIEGRSDDDGVGLIHAAGELVC